MGALAWATPTERADTRPAPNDACGVGAYVSRPPLDGKSPNRSCGLEVGSEAEVWSDRKTRLAGYGLGTRF